MKEVKKKWGKEEWIINEPEYCCKWLYIDKGACCSFHAHRRKKETFKVIEGKVHLWTNYRIYTLKPKADPVTIDPLTIHFFLGLADSIMLEISTHHDDEDVIRFSESRGVNE